MNFLYYVSIAKYLAFFTILYYILGLLFISKIESKPYISKDNYRILDGILLIVAVFVIFSFCDGDNFHYIKWFYYANNGGDVLDTSVQEPIYQLLSYCLNGNYFLFRILIWGSAIFLFCLTSKRLTIPPRVSLICLYCLFIFIFSYARASLGICIYFYGFSFLIKPIRSNKLIGYIYGFILIMSSVLFHTSMALLIVLTIPIIIFPIVKDTKLALLKILLYIFCLISLIVCVIFVVEDLIESLDIPILSSKFSKYTDKEEESKGIFNFIIETCISILMILSIFYSRRSIYRCKSNNVITDKLFLFSVTLLIIGLTLSFMGPGYAIISYRIKYMSIVPITLLLAYCVNHKYLPYKKFIKLEILGVSLILFRLIFYYYLTIKGLGVDLTQSY